MMFPTTRDEIDEAQAAKALTDACEHEDNGRGCCKLCGALRGSIVTWEPPIRRPVHAILGPAPALPERLHWRSVILVRPHPGAGYRVRVGTDSGWTMEIEADVSTVGPSARPINRSAWARIRICGSSEDDTEICAQSGRVGTGEERDLNEALGEAATIMAGKLAALNNLARSFT
jgi:hypothetical protein